MHELNTVVFDLGGVLIDWNPDYVYRHFFPLEAERRWFYEHICTPEWNEEQDGGRSLEEGTRILVEKFPEHEPLIRTYYEKWESMLGGPIAETVEILRELKFNTQTKLFALTNWSAETFPVALKKYDFLHWFDGRIVSGEEKTRKPFSDIYKRLIDRFHIIPSSAVYVDDNTRNLIPAKSLGFHTIHFQNPVQFRKDLKSKGFPL
jgi:2-haloacid dehalogenase